MDPVPPPGAVPRGRSGSCVALICADKRTEIHAQAADSPSTESASFSIVGRVMEEAERLVVAGEPVPAFGVLMQTMQEPLRGADDAPLHFRTAQATMACPLPKQSGYWPSSQRCGRTTSESGWSAPRCRSLWVVTTRRRICSFRRSRPGLPPERRRNVEG